MSNTPDRDQDPDRRFAERLAKHYRPEPLDRAQRARFDAALRERIERRRRGPAWIPALTAAAAALTLAWWIWPLATPPTSSEARVAMATSDWEIDVLLADPGETLAAEEAYLPDEYVALAVAFIDGP
jgi:ferric-dicitrate binding protein FerR (iron transport regulator)